MPGLESFPIAALAWIAFVMAFAGLVHGALGLGFPMVATPLIALVTDIKTAIIIVLLPCLAVILASIVRGGELRSTLREFWPMPIYAFIGSTVGTHIYLAMDSRPIALLLAVVIIVYLNMDRLGSTQWAGVRRHRTLFGAVFGLASGLCESTVNIAAPPLVTYYLALGLAPVAFVKALNICFVTGKSTQFANLLWAGNIGAATWFATLPFALVSVATLVWGIRIRDRVDAATYRRWLRQALFVMAIVLLAQVAASFASM